MFQDVSTIVRCLQRYSYAVRRQHPLHTRPFTDVSCCIKRRKIFTAMLTECFCIMLVLILHGALLLTESVRTTLTALHVACFVFDQPSLASVYHLFSNIL